MMIICTKDTIWYFDDEHIINTARLKTMMVCVTGMPWFFVLIYFCFKRSCIALGRIWCGCDQTQPQPQPQPRPLVLSESILFYLKRRKTRITKISTLPSGTIVVITISVFGTTTRDPSRLGFIIFICTLKIKIIPSTTWTTWSSSWTVLIICYGDTDLFRARRCNNRFG